MNLEGVSKKREYLNLFFGALALTSMTLSIEKGIRADLRDLRRSESRRVVAVLQRDTNRDKRVDYVYQNEGRVFISQEVSEGFFLYRPALITKLDGKTVYQFEDGTYMTLRGKIIKKNKD